MAPVWLRVLLARSGIAIYRIRKRPVLASITKVSWYSLFQLPFVATSYNEDGSFLNKTDISLPLDTAFSSLPSTAKLENAGGGSRLCDIPFSAVSALASMCNEKKRLSGAFLDQRGKKPRSRSILHSLAAKWSRFLMKSKVLVLNVSTSSTTDRRQNPMDRNTTANENARGLGIYTAAAPFTAFLPP